MHQNPTLNYFSPRIAVVFAHSIEARCQVENEDVVGAALAGHAPTTSEFSTILLPNKVCFILQVLILVYVQVMACNGQQAITWTDVVNVLWNHYRHLQYL